MPKLGNMTEDAKTTTGGWTYSFDGKDKELTETAYSAVILFIDITGSLIGKEKELESIPKRIVKRLQAEAAVASNILLRVVFFSNRDLKEIHGFKLAADIDPDVYVINRCHGGTNLNAAVASGIDITLDFAAGLWDQQFDVNGITITVTDGDNNKPGPTAAEIKKLSDKAMKGEKILSYRNMLVGVKPPEGDSNWDYITEKLETFQKEAGISDYTDIGDFDDSAINKLVIGISSIISDTSKNLKAGGGPSQMII